MLYDGNPAWPDGDILWKMVQDSKADMFGASPTYQSILEKNGIVPKAKFDLSNLKSVTLAGSPVSPECQQWFHDNVKQDCWVAPGCGGTDICSGFVGGVRHPAAARGRDAGAAAWASRCTSSARTASS